MDEGFPGLGEACASGVGACEASGLKICNPQGTGTVCSATRLLGSPEGPSGPTCRDALDNDCDGTVDAGDDGCGAASLRAACALPYTHGARGKDCNGKHEIDFSAVNAGPGAVVTAELLAVDTQGNVLATLPVQDGEEAHLKSRLGQVHTVSRRGTARGPRHKLSPPPSRFSG